MITTLNKIRAHEPCRDGWRALMNHLGKTKADDEPLSLETVLDANGLEDALWCLRAVEGRDREIRLYAAWCARKVQKLMIDARSVALLDVVERFARGKASVEELQTASEGAWEAVRATARAAWDAAEAAASTVASTALEAARVTAAHARWAAWAADTAEWTVTTVKSAQEDEFRRMCQEIEAGRDPYPEEDGR